MIEKLKADPEIHELALERAVKSRLTGGVGEKARFVFLDGANAPVTRDLEFATERGQTARFGNLPPMHIFFESKKIGNTGYLRFNMFLDLVRVMTKFGEEVQECMKCDGLIIDLRGNPGGIGGMAMGMAGWLFDKPGQRLGTMLLRDASLNFVINPRPGGLHRTCGSAGRRQFRIDLRDLRGWTEGSGPSPRLRNQDCRCRASFDL